MMELKINLNVIGNMLKSIYPYISAIRRRERKTRLIENYLEKISELYIAYAYLPFVTPSVGANLGFPFKIGSRTVERALEKIAGELSPIIGDDVDPKSIWDGLALVDTAIIVFCSSVYHGDSYGLKFRQGKLDMSERGFCSLAKNIDRPWTSFAGLLANSPFYAREVIGSYARKKPSVCGGCLDKAERISRKDGLEYFKRGCRECYELFYNNYHKILIYRWRGLLGSLLKAKSDFTILEQLRDSAASENTEQEIVLETLPARIMAALLRAYSWYTPDYEIISIISKILLSYYRLFPEIRDEIDSLSSPRSIFSLKTLQSWTRNAKNLTCGSDISLIVPPLRPDEVASDLVSYIMSEFAHRYAAQQYNPSLADRFTVFQRLSPVKLLSDFVLQIY